MRALSQPNSPVCLFHASSVLESSIKPKETECFALLRVAYTAINLKRWFYPIQVRYYFDFTGIETAQRSHRGSINKQPVDYGNRTAWADPRQRGARLQRFVFNLCRYSSSPMPLRRFMVVKILRRFRWKSMGMLELERRAWEFKVPSADSIRCYCSENYPASLRFAVLRSAWNYQRPYYMQKICMPVSRRVVRIAPLCSTGNYSIDYRTTSHEHVN